MQLKVILVHISEAIPYDTFLNMFKCYISIVTYLICDKRQKMKTSD